MPGNGRDGKDVHGKTAANSEKPTGIQGQPSPGCEGCSNAEAIGATTHGCIVLYCIVCCCGVLMDGESQIGRAFFSLNSNQVESKRSTLADCWVAAATTTSCFD